ncbi:Isoflavipucine cluster transcription factor [Colletotrichum sidae]|uniref:Isoflavipucine cluster transcription factor n=1 Tax=Colletotrichum sidae TaxID=1347389 RepID=A0A4R8TEA9_9PEZI|nr:Isoflavipucine cluster transcription factor [Colletotrichum sidae]
MAADAPNRKACDRCHTQKLSCKRVGDEACERCVRLKTLCKSSPSLRYRKQLQQQQQQQQNQQNQQNRLHQQQQQQQQPSTDGLARSSIPSPKRQRADSGSQVVRPDLPIVETRAAVGESSDLGDHAVVSPEAMLDMVDFDFSFGQPGALFQPDPPAPSHSHHHQHQLHQPYAAASMVDDLMSVEVGSSSNAWSPPHSATSGSVFTSPMAASSSSAVVVDPGCGRVLYLGSPEERLPSRSGQHQHQHQHQHHHHQPSYEEIITPPPRPRKRAARQQRTRQIALRPASSNAPGGPSLVGDWMPQITSVNSRLFELSRCLPHQADLSDDAGSRVSSPGDGRPAATPFSIDELFKVSRHFAQLLADMAPVEGGASPASDNDDDDDYYHFYNYNYHENQDTASSSLSAGPDAVTPAAHAHAHAHDAPAASRGLDSLLADPATCLLVLSTYVRLLDTYQKAFSCIHSQLGHLQPGGALFQSSWELPGVTVGSFAVDSTPALRVFLAVQLAEDFLAQMRRAAASSLDPSLRPADGSSSSSSSLSTSSAAGGGGVGGGGGGGGGGGVPDAAATSMFSNVVRVSFQALKGQEESLGQELRSLRKDMERYLDG